MGYKLLSVSADDAGTWVHRSRFGAEKNILPTSIEIDGTFVGTVTISVTNVADPTVTPPTSPKTLLTNTTNQVYDLGKPYDWYRAAVTSYSSGTVEVIVGYTSND